MVPTGISAALAFLVLIVPGFVLESLLLNRRPKSDESTFSEANRVVFSSLLSSGLSVAISGLLLFAIHRKWYNELQTWLTLGKYPKSLPIAVLYSLIILEATLAIAAVWIWDFFWGEDIFGPKRLSHDSAWRRHLSDRAPQNIPLTNATRDIRQVMVDVELKSGRFLRGYIADFTPDHEWADRELSLTSPIYERDAKGTWNYVPPHIVTISSTSIISISVFHMYLNPAESFAPTVDGSLNQKTSWRRSTIIQKIIDLATFAVIVLLITGVWAGHLGYGVAISFVFGYFIILREVRSAIAVQISNPESWRATLRRLRKWQIVGFVALATGLIVFETNPGQAKKYTTGINISNGLLLIVSLYLVLGENRERN